MLEDFRRRILMPVVTGDGNFWLVGNRNWVINARNGVKTSKREGKGKEKPSKRREKPSEWSEILLNGVKILEKA